MNGTQVGGRHYEEMGIQPVEYIHANKLDFFQGNVIKYIHRHKAKNGAEDVKKDINYAIMILKNDYGVDAKLVIAEEPAKA